MGKYFLIPTSTKTTFNQDIIKDSLKLQQVFNIPWLKYIKDFMNDLGHPEYYDDPGSIFFVT